MFSIVSMQDVLINLNGGESLFKTFERSRTRKRSTSIKGSPVRKDIPFTVQKVWVLPSHIIVLSGESSPQLIAYNQYPKMTYLTVEKLTDLLESVKDKEIYGDVHDVFVDLNENKYVFVLLKNGSLIVWSFMKSTYEWKFVDNFSLCKGKGCQLTSYAFNGETITWCEKRTASQCCIVATDISITDMAVTIDNTHAVLHNCLPMLIYPMANSQFCLIPVAGRPAGLLLFWSHGNNEITVCIWCEGLNKHLKATSSDFQNIITSSISLWINPCSTEHVFVAMAIHPTTKELIILQQDLRLFLIRLEETSHKLQSKQLCVLEVNEEKESFSKRIYNIFLWHRLILLQMLDGELLIFDIRNGLYLWKTDTFKLNSPNVWVRKGPFPTLGVWNKSGIWMFRSKSVRDQVKEINSDLQDEEFNTQRKSLPDITDIDYALNAYDKQNKGKESNKSRRKIKQGVNRKTKMPITYLFGILEKWKSDRISSELALHLMLKHKQSLKDDDDEFMLTCHELIFLISQIDDPILLLSLFSEQGLPLAVKKHLIKKLKNILNSPSAINIDKEIIAIITEYVELQDQIEDCYFTDHGRSSSTEEENQVLTLQTEHIKFLSSTKEDIEVLFRYLLEYDEDYIVAHVVPVLVSEDEHKTTLWEVLFSKHCAALLQKLCVTIWSTNPTLLLQFLKKASEVIINTTSLQQVISKSALLDWVLQLIHLPSLKETSQDDVTNCVNIYCELMLLREVANYEQCCQLYLKYNMIDNAVDILLNNCESASYCSLFYRVLTYLVQHKQLPNYVHRLMNVIPEKFNMAELYNVLLIQNTELDTGNVFVQQSTTDLDIGTLKPLFELVLQREASSSERSLSTTSPKLPEGS